MRMSRRLQARMKTLGTSFLGAYHSRLQINNNLLIFILIKLLGRQCQDIDECRHANPCVHGKCHNLIGSFYCDCIETGFTGKICDEDLDECKCAEGDGEYALRNIFKFTFQKT